MKLKINKSVNENELIEGCRRNKAKAQKALYERFSPKMLGVCIRYIKDRSEAEYVMTGGFMKVFDNLNYFKGQGSFEGWIRKIMVNESLLYLRKNKAMYLEVDIDHASEQVNMNDMVSNMQADELMTIIQHLPVGYRTVFNLYAIEGYSHKEIADKMEISEGTSKSQLNRARALLKQRILLVEREKEKKNDKRV